MKTFKLHLTITLHHMLIVGVATTVVVLVMFAPVEYMIAGLLAAYKLLTRRTVCPITAKENELRRALGKREISGFIGHYYVKPVRLLINLIKRGIKW